jgi:hypothetical protein
MTTKKTPNPIPPEKLAAYDKVVAAVPGVERRGDKLPYTSHNSHMFSFLSETGALALRLPAAERAAFIEKYQTALFVAHGAVMKEYVAVPDALLLNTKALKKYFELSYAYAQTLKPKPARKPKSKK